RFCAMFVSDEQVCPGVLHSFPTRRLFRSAGEEGGELPQELPALLGVDLVAELVECRDERAVVRGLLGEGGSRGLRRGRGRGLRRDRKSTRLNSSHDQISYAVFCLKKKTQQ